MAQLCRVQLAVAASHRVMWALCALALRVMRRALMAQLCRMQPAVAASHHVSWALRALALRVTRRAGCEDTRVLGEDARVVDAITSWHFLFMC